MTLCYNCFKEKTEGEEPCPHCGFDLSENVKKYPVALRAGTLLNHRYMVGRVLGQELIAGGSEAIIYHSIVHRTPLDEINDKLFEENEKALC